MGDLGDYWREHKEYKRDIRQFWHECPKCAQDFGTASKVPPGCKCRHHDWVAPGKRGEDKDQLNEYWHELRQEENKRIAARKKDQAEKKKANAKRRCPHCEVLLKDEARKDKHVAKVHGPDGRITK